jgi:ABC-type branched-subunit amino acid transport system substrate-binding protein
MTSGVGRAAEDGRFAPASQGRRASALAILTPLVFEPGFDKALFAGIVLFSVASCGRSRPVFVAHAEAPAAHVVRIGSHASFTGAAAAASQSEERGLALAIDEWNASEQAPRLRVERVTYDDQGRATGATAAVERLSSADRVDVVFTTPAGARASATAGTGAPPVACATCPVASISPAIGLAPSRAERADVLAELVVRTMNLSKLATLVRRDVAEDHAAAAAFATSLKARGIDAVAQVPFTPESITDVLTQLLADAPQAVLVAFDGDEAALVGRALRRRAVPSAVLFFGAPRVEVLPDADRIAALEGALFPSLFEAARTDAAGRRFVAAFEARYGARPDERAYLAHAAGTRVLEALLAARASNTFDPRAALALVRPAGPLTVVRIEHGTFVPLSPPRN